MQKSIVKFIKKCMKQLKHCLENGFIAFFQLEVWSQWHIPNERNLVSILNTTNTFILYHKQNDEEDEIIIVNTTDLLQINKNTLDLHKIPTQKKKKKNDSNIGRSKIAAIKRVKKSFIYYGHTNSELKFKRKYDVCIQKDKQHEKRI